MLASSRRKFLIALGSVGLANCLPLWRVFAGSSQKKVSVDADKVAIQGYDTVAYFTEGKPTKGTTDFEVEWQGARWRFASASHRDLFNKQPDTYAPRFGGFCAGAIVDGVFVRPDPEAWVIVDGKLYLNFSKDGLVEWQQDAIANIAKAQVRWDALSQ
jgi:hypothetical protein